MIYTVYITKYAAKTFQPFNYIVSLENLHQFNPSVDTCNIYVSVIITTNLKMIYKIKVVHFMGSIEHRYLHSFNSQKKMFRPFPPYKLIRVYIPS